MTTTRTRSETHARAAKAARYANYTLHVTGQPLTNDGDWALAASDATQAMTAAIVDVARSATRTLPKGTKGVEIAYNTGRRAAIAAQAFAAINFDPADAEDEQWGIVGVTSEGTRDATQALYSLFAELGA